MKFYDETRPVHIETNASEVGLEAGYGRTEIE